MISRASVVEATCQDPSGPQLASLLNNDHLTEWTELPSGVSFAQYAQ